VLAPLKGHRRSADAGTRARRLLSTTELFCSALRSWQAVVLKRFSVEV
jgi:hypothetical protein